ncbi:MAG: flagellar type III secretion system protein FlhB, partial [Pseudomonadota bacterium]|nr:flagellar type III secretion system protein FlhB [Pseudomonadota bacterium]
MSDSSAQDRNLPASPRKLAKAREEGQVARSRDLGHFALLAGAAMAMLGALPGAAAHLKAWLGRSLSFDRAQALSSDALSARLADGAAQLLWLLLPLGLGLSAIAIAAALAMSGWTWTLKPMTPRLGVLNPMAGLGRVFSKAQLVDALKASGLALILGGIGAWYLREHIQSFAGLLALPLPAAVAAASDSMLGGLGLLLLALALFAAIDVPLQKRFFAQKMKMSHQEQKQEHKELEGNTEVKSKVKARMREMNKRRMMAAVPKADLVVMNPTHYAVALKYDDAKMAAPRVVAKGADLLALRIRDLAKGSDVPVLDAPVLARALYAHAELDREIPAALFAAVAQVLAYVYQLRAAMS